MSRTARSAPRRTSATSAIRISNEGYSLYNKACVKCNVENCALCSKENFCYQCNTDQAFVADSNGQCAYCTDHCATCTSTDCTACGDGYKLTDGTCTALCSIAGCSTCVSATACATCDSDLTLLSDSTCSCGIAHCKTCVKSVCQECADGYSYNNHRNTCNGTNSSSERIHVKRSTLALIASLITFATMLL
ncbi:hypothetical protein STCU_12342 [Strigomonas culicis]|uniref:Surface antigen-like protein n=1 Tax=Strigomonas culicis TaxID=28005 RepID=S9UKE7_9TRYP|nr:hypothetical protein STCU_12342 [Strigomonas culicis]|eukprot:EPY15106.1 hypothetical protein STCU_12342 [Strigomonas culicis]